MGCTRCVFFKNSHIVASHSMFFALAQCANLSQAVKSYVGECELSLFPRLFVMLVNLSSRILHRCSQGRHGHPKFLAYVAILCFEKRRPKQKYCCSPKVKYFAPPKKTLGWLCHWYPFFVKCSAVGSPKVEKVGTHYSSLNCV